MQIGEYPLNFIRNGQLKRQAQRTQEKIDNDTVYYRMAAMSSFKTLSFLLEEKYKLHHDTTQIQKISYSPRNNKSPLVCHGHMILTDEASKSEIIFENDIFSKKANLLGPWNFHIYKGAYSEKGTDWKKGEYIHTLEGNNLRNFVEFNNRYKQTFSYQGNENPIDYIILEGEDPVSEQPIYIEMGNLPIIEKPAFRKSIDKTKEIFKPFFNPKISFFKKHYPVKTVRSYEDDLKLYR